MLVAFGPKGQGKDGMTIGHAKAAARMDGVWREGRWIAVVVSDVGRGDVARGVVWLAERDSLVKRARAGVGGYRGQCRRERDLKES